MAEVVAQSLQHLSRSDIEAMVSYIRKLPASKAPTTTPELPVSQTRANKLFAQGKALYAQHCANCHGEDGRGEAFKYPALAGNRLVTSASTNNVMRSVLFGGFAPSTQGNPRPYGMPPFRPQLSDEELAAVLSFIRASWGNNAAPVSPAQISRF
jgi:mono/diheme cytochrome c family protein